MSNTKRLFMKEEYALIDGITAEACDHSNYDDYFEVCTDCNTSKAELMVEHAETIRDGLREDGINV